MVNDPRPWGLGALIGINLFAYNKQKQIKIEDGRQSRRKRKVDLEGK